MRLGTDAQDRSDPGWTVLLLSLLAVAVIPAAVLPGDAPFINDDAALLGNALGANAAGELATHGLLGTKGVRYGPLPTWIYQGLLQLTHDPFAIVVLHGVLLGVSTAVAVHVLARATGMWRWFGLVLIASPYLWFYERLIWDNTFNLPITAFAFASYATFLRTRSRTALSLTPVLLVASTLVHLMSLAFVVPMALHLLVLERRALWKSAWSAGVPAVALLLLSWGYWRGLLGGPADPGPVVQSGALDGFVFALTGSRLLSAVGLDYFYGDLAHAGAGWSLVSWATAIVFPFTLAGSVLAIRRVVGALRARARAPLDDLAGISLAIVGSQALLDAVARADGHPHYHCATWIAHAFLAWLAVDALARAPWARARAGMSVACAVWVGALLVADVRALLLVHRRSGTRTTSYGATLANQVRIVQEMARHSPRSEVRTDIAQFVEFPHGLAVLRALVAPEVHERGPAARLLLRYASSDPADARVELVVE